jgi:AraC-like DNA-binding protein
MPRRSVSPSVFQDPEFRLACLRIDNHGNTRIHRHDFHELVVILAGRGRHITDREEYGLEAGDVFLIRGDMAHGYADTERMTLVNILFDPTRLGLPMSLLRDLPGYHTLFRVEPRLRAASGFRNRLRLQEEELAEVAGMIVRLQQELTRKMPGYRFQASAQLMTLIAFVSRCYSHPDRHEEKPLLRMGEVLSYIEQNYREPITIRQLTKIAHMSESTLMRQFRRVMSRSPIDHVIRVRILKAAERLKRGDTRVTEAAFDSGFSDSNYFSRQFRQVLGVSPREYRKRHA